MAATIWQRPITLLRCQLVRQWDPAEAKCPDVSQGGVLRFKEDPDSQGNFAKYWCTAAVSEFR